MVYIVYNYSIIYSIYRCRYIIYNKWIHTHTYLLTKTLLIWGIRILASRVGDSVSSADFSGRAGFKFWGVW